MSLASPAFRRVFPRLLLSLLVIGIGRAAAEQKIWTLHGRVLDQEGRPVARASVATVWGANGVTLEQLHNFEKDGKPHPELMVNEGRMEPWGIGPVETGPDGRFAIELRSSNDCKLLAVDRDRKRGALILVDSRHPPSQVQCKLVALVRVFGRLRVAATGQPTRDQNVVRLPERAELPLGYYRLGVCSSVQSRFEYWLPPGDYRFEAFCHDPPRLELSEPHPIGLTSGQREFDCGTFDLVPAVHLLDRLADATKAETWRDLAKRYGDPSPAWHAIDARGIPKLAQPADFRGKWVLVYFWGFSCGPCMEKTLPKLRRFYEAHQSRRDRFELVSICSELDSKWHTMADLDRELAPIVKSIWAGKELPFPVVLDNTSTSMENFGVEFFGATVLINPAGHLVPGDESTLAKILEHNAAVGP